MLLYNRLLVILKTRGLTPNEKDVVVSDTPALGEHIATWNAAALGAVPTAAEIAAVTDAEATDAGLANAANDMDKFAALQAVAQLDFEERQKLTVKAGQTLRTAVECKARLKAIYQSLL